MADDKKKVKKNKSGTVQLDTKTRKTSLTGKDFTNVDYGSNKSNVAAKKAAVRHGKSTTSCNFNKDRTRKSCTTYDKNGKVVSRKVVDVKK